MLQLGAITALLFFHTSCHSQEPTSSMIQWMSFEEAVAKSDKEPKKIFIDIYTDWCGWCKKMDKSTFSEKVVADYINQNYYAVKLDAETKDSIVFRDKVFKFIPEYKANELAVALLSGKMGYPSYVLMDEKYTLMSQPVQSYLTSEQLMPILRFYAENIYKEKSWEEFESGK
jgi:thioredoxin-related protein